jgi:pimeloyl-ACP methyl ester carboxylesterase
MESLDHRSTVLPTPHGDAQLARTGRGPQVLAIHGGPGGYDQGLAWCHHLSDGGCEVIAVSRPGYLRTPLESGARPEDQADLYAAVLDVLDIERVAVLGFSSGGPSAVHFAARHPDRTRALFLDAAILLPYQPPISALQRMTFESSFFIWLSIVMVTRMPRRMTRLMIDGLSTGLSPQQRRAASTWIASDPVRLQSLQEQAASVGPREHRRAGWINDQANEMGLAPLPFENIEAPTLISHGANDAVVPVEHAINAASRADDADLILVEEGHHLLSLSQHYGPVAERQRELAYG